MLEAHFEQNKLPEPSFDADGPTDFGISATGSPAALCTSNIKAPRPSPVRTDSMDTTHTRLRTMTRRRTPVDAAGG